MASLAFTRPPTSFPLPNPTSAASNGAPPASASSTLRAQQATAPSNVNTDGRATSSKPLPRIPPTPLPSSPAAQAKLIRASHLRRLRQLYSLKSAAYAVQFEREAAERRVRRENAIAARRQNGRRGAARGRAERDMSEMANDSEGLGGDEQSQAAIEEEEDELRRQCGLPALGPSSGEATTVDDDHFHHYDLVYTLSPLGSADVYYHGTHPPPPAPVVRCVLRSAQALLDPGDPRDPLDTGAGAASAKKLEALAREIWESPECRPEPPSVDSSGGNGATTEQSLAEAEADWERDMIDSFAGACAERLGMTLASMPLSAAAQAAAGRLALNANGAMPHPTLMPPPPPQTSLAAPTQGAHVATSIGGPAGGLPGMYSHSQPPPPQQHSLPPPGQAYGGYGSIYGGGVGGIGSGVGMMDRYGGAAPPPPQGISYQAPGVQAGAGAASGGPPGNEWGKYH